MALAQFAFVLRDIDPTETMALIENRQLLMEARGDNSTEGELSNHQEVFTLQAVTEFLTTSNCFLSIDQCWGMLFLQQLFECTCKMEKRERSGLTFAKRAFLMVICVSASVAAEEISILLLSKYQPLDSRWALAFRLVNELKSKLLGFY